MHDVNTVGSAASGACAFVPGGGSRKFDLVRLGSS